MANYLKILQKYNNHRLRKLGLGCNKICLCLAMNKWLSILVGSCIQIGSSSTDFGSISVSGQLPTYPSPKVNVGLGGGGRWAVAQILILIPDFNQTSSSLLACSNNNFLPSLVRYQQYHCQENFSWTYPRDFRDYKMKTYQYHKKIVQLLYLFPHPKRNRHHERKIQ